MNCTIKKSGVSQAIQLSQFYQHQTNIIELNNYKVKRANTEIDKLNAYHLAYKEYLNKGYVEESLEGIYKIHQDDQPSTNVFIVEDGAGNTVGSATSVSNLNHLPALATFSKEINKLKTEHKKITEICRLVIDSDSRNNLDVLTLLFNAIGAFSTNIDKSNYIICEVNPRHSTFYVRALGFKHLSDQKYFKNNFEMPAVLLGLEITSFEKLVKNTIAKKKIRYIEDNNVLLANS